MIHQPPSHTVFYYWSPPQLSLVFFWDILLKEFIQSSSYQSEILWCWDITQGNENPESVTFHEVTQSLSSSTDWVWSKQAEQKNGTHQQDKKLFKVIGVYCIIGEVTNNWRNLWKSDFRRGEGGKKSACKELKERGSRLWGGRGCEGWRRWG